MKIITLLIAVLLLSSFSLAQTDPGREYINYEYKAALPGATLPNGVKHLGGSLIGDFNANPIYGISQLEKGKTKMLWLEVSTGSNASGVTGWRVLDAISFANVKEDDYIFIPGDPSIYCTEKGRDIINLVGIGSIIRKDRKLVPSKLWIADRFSRRFEPFGIKDVTCMYEEP